MKRGYDKIPSKAQIEAAVKKLEKSLARVHRLQKAVKEVSKEERTRRT